MTNGWSMGVQGPAKSTRAKAVATSPGELERLPRFLLLRRLIRSGATVQIEDAATRRFVATGSSGERVAIPAGHLSPEQVRDLLDRLELDVGDFLDMR